MSWFNFRRKTLWLLHKQYIGETKTWKQRDQSEAVTAISGHPHKARALEIDRSGWVKEGRINQNKWVKTYRLLGINDKEVGRQR